MQGADILTESGRLPAPNADIRFLRGWRMPAFIRADIIEIK